MRNVTLILDDGSRFHGKSFGYEKPVAGEVVFNTAMTGYPESLTDPSYAGQLMTLTYPLVGNYGVPPFTVEPNGLATFMESERIHAEAIIVSDYSEDFSHWNAVESLADWLKREQVPGITGIDTRELTKVLREHGVMMGRIVFDDVENEIDNSQLTIDNYEDVNYVDRVSCKEIIVYTGKESPLHFPITTSTAQLNCQLSTVNCQLKRVVLLDCGVKSNILRCLLKRDVEVIRVPWDYDYNELEFDGLFISNGPGDPDTCDAAVQNIRRAMKNEKLPIFGICMGNQLLSKAGGAKIYKLKYGHRSHNQPVRMVGTERCFITSQNHGYAVDNTTLTEDWEPLFINMNDGSNEGIRHKRNPWFSAQFHPEAASGPTDTEFLFDEFVKLL
ncbi:glutamine-hydrolyzing carbamoyl-phosphate synthase small subunit [Bacteroides intestinalis]|jgi:carbamoyl-phosphate synthase small subunit|uniref:glutamine-hydrolyzing carbamoyl-phosphate synthase small subunit n=1 Tax=Bacteroides intestinalis TaxID=329854 RepID=UPI000E4C39CB|nr:glutamine-hydrolyzing carbamoyl-phosphate synthase small subunit [Bacteroides intestinalis]RGX85047.1 carbamoyl-phosphate synthase (glutamine-hydrolyzing) small subunit [Bacteroides intestinalis]